MVWTFYKNEQIKKAWTFEGTFLEQDNNNVLIVGSRKPSRYGKKVIEQVIPQLVEQGFTILSDFTPGCDLYAQRVALDSGGRVVGVLGYGIDHIKHYSDAAFVKRLLKSDRGGIVSPFYATQNMSREALLYRSKVLAYMCSSLLFIEGTRESKSFYAISIALEKGKNIFSVPGSIFSQRSEGPNYLISQGAFPLFMSQNRIQMQ